MRVARASAQDSRGRSATGAAVTPDAIRDFASSHRAPVIGALVALVVVVALYGPTCSLYQAWRDNGMLLRQQAQANEESVQLEDDIESLMTEDGIKDEARERGYVESGEKRIVVEGLEEPSSDESAGDSSDTPWYLRVTDFIFRYEAQS